MVCSFQCGNAVQDGYQTWHIRYLCGCSCLNDKYSYSHLFTLMYTFCFCAVLFIYFSKFLSENGVMLLIFFIFQGADSFFRTVISNMEKVYLNRNPTAKTILELIRSYDGDHICYDHLAFRTFGVSTSVNKVTQFPCMLHSVESCSINYGKYK